MEKKKEEQKMPMLPLLDMPLRPLGPVVTDPFGSYTGRPADITEIPVQDADDL